MPDIWTENKLDRKKFAKPIVLKLMGQICLNFLLSKFRIDKKKKFVCPIRLSILCPTGPIVSEPLLNIIVLNLLHVCKSTSFTKVLLIKSDHVLMLSVK